MTVVLARERSHVRARVAAAAVVVLGVALLAALLLSSGGEQPPATGTASLVPAQALAYVHLSTDDTRPAVRRANALLRRLPDGGAGPASIADRILAVVGGTPGTSFASLRPWLGREAALALLAGTGATASSEVVLDVRSRTSAHTWITRAGATPAGSYRSVALLRYPTGAELAFVGHYLVVGTDPVVRSAIDVSHGTASLSGAGAYRRAMADAPAGRALDIYFSGDGVSRVLATRSGLLGALGALLSAPSLEGAAISVSASSPGLAVHVHSVLSSPVASGTAFHPSLAAVLPAGSPLMLEGHGLRALAPRLFAVMGKAGLLPALPDLLSRIGGALSAGGLDVGKVLDLFGGDTAIALARGSGAPALVIVTRTSNMAAARTTLAALEAPLQQLFTAPASGPGVAPVSSDVAVDGVTVHEMQLGTGLSLDLAVFRGLVVVATSARGIADVAAQTHALDREPGFATVLAHHADNVTSLGFFDLSQLLSFAEQTQLPRDGGYRALQPDLADIREVGMSSAGEGTDTTAELSLHFP
jgi:hypothetical protein